tara:strand:- start:2621 stop:3853 length:1233 start_codon:yes stop_codon:yes gene_type:complete
MSLALFFLILIYFITTKEINRLFLIAFTLLCWPNWFSVTLYFGFQFNLSLCRLLLFAYILINIKKIPYYFLKSKLLYYAIYTIIMLFVNFTIWDLKLFLSERYLIAFILAPIIANKLLIESNFNSFMKGISIGAIILLIISIVEIIFAKPIESFGFLSSFIVDTSTGINVIKEDIMTRGGFVRPTAGYWNNIILGLAFVSFAPFLMKYKSFGRITNYILLLMAGLTFSRTAILGLVIIFLINFKKISYKIKVLSAFLLFMFSIYFIRESINTGYADQSLFSIQSRLGYIYILLENYDISSLIFGFGIGEFHRLILLDIAAFLPADNSIAMLVFSQGIIGSILLLIPFFKTLRMTYKFRDFYMFSFIFLTLILIFISNSVIQDNKLFLLSIILILYLNLKYGKYNNLHSRI